MASEDEVIITISREPLPAAGGTAAITSPEERREHPRSPAYGRAILRVIGKAGVQEARVINISAGGALLETSPQLAVGTRVRLRISSTSGRELEVNGDVVRNDDPSPESRQTVAVRFQGISSMVVAIFKKP